jgi:transcriptional regulator with XRE-family HTH domain
VRKARRAADLSQRELAGRAGISAAYLSRVESGQRIASLEVLVALAAELEITGLELLAGDARGHCPLCGRAG